MNSKSHYDALISLSKFPLDSKVPSTAELRRLARRGAWSKLPWGSLDPATMMWLLGIKRGRIGTSNEKSKGKT
jgi:hypothetical protein